MAISNDLVRRLTARARGEAEPQALPGSSKIAEAVGLGGSRPQAIQRLQIGLAGVTTMLLLVGLASIIESRASQAQANAVPEAAPTVAPSSSPAQDDPLVSAGVVPDMPEEEAPAPTLQPPVLPEEGATDGRP